MRRRRRPRAVRVAAGVAAVLAASAALPASAQIELWRHGDASITFSGSLREILATDAQTDSETFFEDFAADAAAAPSCVLAAGVQDCAVWDELGSSRVVQSLTRLRSRLDIRLTDWLGAVGVYDLEVLAGQIDTLERGLSGAIQSETFFRAEGVLASGTNVELSNALYRGYVEVTLGGFDGLVGRQRIAWGVGRLWNPIDRFNAIPPLSIEPDQSAGVDSVLMRWNFSGFTFLEAVYAPGPRRQDSRYGARVHGVLWDADLSLMGGVFEQAPTVGADFARNVSGAALRAELVYTHPERDVWRIGDPQPAPLPDFWQAVVSLDYNFDLGTGLYALVEYLYNGNALGVGAGRIGPLLGFLETTDVYPFPVPDPPPPFPPGTEYWAPGSADLFGSSRVVTAAEHNLGIDLAYDLTPEIRLDFITLIDASAGSAAFFPTLRYDPAGSLELTAGVQGFVGSLHSQYGDRGVLAFLMAEWFF